MPKIAIKDIRIGNRQRKEYHNIEEMTKSLARHGLIQPVVLDQNNGLIAGGRRLAGAVNLGWTEIDYTTREALDDISRKELELEENLQRENLTWVEEVRAVRDLYELRKARYEADGGRGGDIAQVMGLAGGKGYSMQDAAMELDKSKGSVVADINLARALDEFPEIAEEATKSAAWKRYQREKELQTRQELARREAARREASAPRSESADGDDHSYTGGSGAAAGAGAAHDESPPADVRQQIRKASWKGKGTLYHADSRDVLRLLADKHIKFDCIVTDPPFGLGLFKKGQSTSGKRLAENEGGMYDDDPYKIMEMLDQVFMWCGKLLKPDGHAYVFFHMTRYEEVFQMVRRQFGTCEETPLIWSKNTPAIGDPNETWVYSYEPCFWVNRGRKMVIPQAFNVLRHDTIPPSQKIHPTQKPTALLRHLISASCVAGETILDPFAGSGSTLVAASQVGCHFIGVEREEEFYRKACEYMATELSSEKKEGEVTGAVQA